MSEQENGTVPAEAPTLEGLTADLHEAFQRGDRAEVQRIDAQRNELAKQLTGEVDGGSGGSISDDEFAEVETWLSPTDGGGELLGDRETIGAAVARGGEIAAAYPELAGFMLNLAEEIPAIRTPLLKMLAGTAPASTAKPKGSAPMPQQSSNDGSIPPAEGARAEALQDRIEAIRQANPPGTDAYKHPKVQREVDRLYRELYGDAPIVGQGGRTV